MAGWGVLRLPEYFRAPFECTRQTGASEDLHGNLENVAGEGARRCRAGRSLWRTRLPAAVLRYLHRTNRRRAAPPRTFFLACRSRVVNREAHAHTHRAHFQPAPPGSSFVSTSFPGKIQFD